jgi:hypothetical protein
MNFNFLNILKKKIGQLPNLLKVRPVGADLFHADSLTDG